MRCGSRCRRGLWQKTFVFQVWRLDADEMRDLPGLNTRSPYSAHSAETNVFGQNEGDHVFKPGLGQKNPT